MDTIPCLLCQRPVTIDLPESAVGAFALCPECAREQCRPGTLEMTADRQRHMIKLDAPEISHED